MSMQRILVVEDDVKLAALVKDYLSAQGFEVGVEGRGDVARQRIVDEQPDAVVLDVMLPGMDGLTICREVRDAYHGAILMLTARGDDIDEVLGLEIGADDYMAKPVRPRVLLARLKSLLRRTNRPADRTEERVVRVGRLELDAGNRTVSFAGAGIDLTTAEFDLLMYLAQRAGEVVDRDQIYVDVRGIPWDGVDRSIDLRVSRVRKKLGTAEVIKSVRGTGYLLVANP